MKVGFILVSRFAGASAVLLGVAASIVSVPGVTSAALAVEAPTDETIVTGRLFGSIKTGAEDAWWGSAEKGETVPVAETDPSQTWSIPKTDEAGEVRLGSLCLTIPATFLGAPILGQCDGSDVQQFTTTLKSVEDGEDVNDAEDAEPTLFGIQSAESFELVAGAEPAPVSITAITADPDITDLQAVEVTADSQSYDMSLMRSLPEDVTTDRIQGDDRFKSAAAVSKATYPGSGSASVVVLASGDMFPDALSAGPAASKLGGPLLLVQGDELPKVTKEEIERLQPEKVVLVGGKAVVSEELEADVKKLMASLSEDSEESVVRVSGSDRYETSREIANYAFTADETEAAFVASGDRFPDALTLGAAAASAQAPLFLVGGTPSPTDAATANQLGELGLNVSSVRVAGGAASVDQDTVKTLTDAVENTARVQGDDRFLTADAISNDVFAPTTEQAYIVNGMNFPDGLVTAALAGKTKSPLYIAPSDCVPQGVFTEITRLGITKITLIGGTAVLTEAVEELTPCS